MYQSYTTHIPVNNQGNTAYFLISQATFTTSIPWLEKVCRTIHVMSTIGSLCWSTDSDWPRKIETQSQNLHGYQVNYKFCFYVTPGNYLSESLTVFFPNNWHCFTQLLMLLPSFYVSVSTFNKLHNQIEHCFIHSQNQKRNCFWVFTIHPSVL